MRNWLRRWWKTHIVNQFPYPDVCFDCDSDSCAGCPVIETTPALEGERRRIKGTALCRGPARIFNLRDIKSRGYKFGRRRMQQFYVLNSNES